MSRRLARALIRLYPRRWRTRYGEELESVVEEARMDGRALLDLAVAAARERLRVVLPPTLAFIFLAPALLLLQMEVLVGGQLAAAAAGHPIAFSVSVGPVLLWEVQAVTFPSLFAGQVGAGAVALAVLGGLAGAAWRARRSTG